MSPPRSDFQDRTERKTNAPKFTTAIGSKVSCACSRNVIPIRFPTMQMCSKTPPRRTEGTEETMAVCQRKNKTRNVSSCHLQHLPGHKQRHGYWSNLKNLLARADRTLENKCHEQFVLGVKSLVFSISEESSGTQSSLHSKGTTASGPSIRGHGLRCHISQAPHYLVCTSGLPAWGALFKRDPIAKLGR